MLHRLHVMKLLTFLLVFLFLQVHGKNDSSSDWYDRCNHLVACGSLDPVGFPFWGGLFRPKECGYPHLGVSCDDGFTPTMVIDGFKYILIEVIPENKIIRLRRKDYSENGNCPKLFLNTTMDFNRFQYGAQVENLTVLYGCKPPKSLFVSPFRCKIDGVAYHMGYYLEGIVNPTQYDCNTSVVIQGFSLPQILAIGLKEVIHFGFDLNYKLFNDDEAFCKICEGQSSNGTCGFDSQRNKTVCLCPNGSVGSFCGNTLPPSPQGENGSSKHHKLNKLMIIGLCVGIGGGLIVGLAIYITFFLRKRHQAPSTSSTPVSSQPLQQVQQLVPSRPSPNSILEEASCLGVRLFSYSDLKKATHDFDASRVLGGGAFGTVYYGKLPDGQEVAVKRFSHHNEKILQQYMSEVRVLSHLQHKNLLVLFGFTSRKSKEILLVYEYLSNGTVWDHLHGKFSQIKLPWPLRVKIAVETAEGLLFLHQNQVIHRDVKTTNILLDDNFQVKVADFGLAKFFSQQSSHVSTLPQGTPGYVDPEYFRNYRLNEKSDVYGLGVVLMELVSGKEAVDSARPSMDINLFNMARDRIGKGEMDVFVDSSLPYDVDDTIKTSVDCVAQLGFRCLHETRVMRPSMLEVLDTLKQVEMRLKEYEAGSSGATGH